MLSFKEKEKKSPSKPTSYRSTLEVSKKFNSLLLRGMPRNSTGCEGGPRRILSPARGSGRGRRWIPAGGREKKKKLMKQREGWPK